MIKEYKDNKEDFIDELYTRIVNKNYLIQSNLNDDYDYICAKFKSELCNYYTIQSKDYKKQRSLTKSIVRKLNDMKNYPMFKDMINIISTELELFNLDNYKDKDITYLEIYEEDYIQTYKTRYIKESEFDRIYKLLLNNELNPKEFTKSNKLSQVKYFVNLVNNNDLFMSIINHGILDISSTTISDLCRYYKIYKECEDITRQNIISDKELICDVLDYSIDFNNLDMNLDDKQIIKFICQRINWRFGNLKRKLPYYKFHINGISESNVKYIMKDKLVLSNLFAFGDNKIQNNIDEIDYLNKNQKQFIKDVVALSRDASIKFNKKGEVDISKKEIADKLGLTLTAFDKKCLRIRNKNFQNGIKNYGYNVITKSKFNKLDSESALADMYITEEERQEFRLLMSECEYDYEEYNFNYNYWTSFDAKRTSKEDMIKFEEYKNRLDNSYIDEFEYDDYEEEYYDEFDY